MCGASAGLIIRTQANSNGDKESQWWENKALFWPLQARGKETSLFLKITGSDGGIFSPFLDASLPLWVPDTYVYVLLFNSLPNHV